ncbi:alkene reductase [Muricauda sp. 334s03]|uniref:Alkene reductase n=1 Tax=Flagellimonas yonaguniensis TaxID=3031325 RepID=A0ABT5Y311_9FLAO|nr:alkene reductase [[Muricauda] yonaguniensis]MDF0717696.1 alkene reductase [[Muricauda] yonaguniensis]
MKLLEQTQLGRLSLKNRMVMSAMTRNRADENGVVHDMTVTYYKQRATAGLIITEAINISEGAIGSPLTPGIYTQAQIDAWKKVTKAVHQADGKIVAQLWHTGRIGHSVDRKGVVPVAPSAIAIRGAQHFTSQGLKDYEVPRALDLSEIKEIINDYGKAASNAMEAGFDGVEVHAANGYLPHQFLSDSANHRKDEYGGSIENRCQFVLDVMKEVVHTIGRDRVGIKISPLHPYGNMVFDDPKATFMYLLNELNTLDFAFVEIMKKNPMFPLLDHYPQEDEIELWGSLIKTKLIANTSYTKENAEMELKKGIADLISFGSMFLANPDLPKRFRLDAELNHPDQNTFFGGNEKGYIDYPTL